MARRDGYTTLLAYIAANYIKAIVNFISPTKHNSALTDLIDTLAPYIAEVADMATLNALTVETDFSQGEKRIVTSDTEGYRGVYQYVYNSDTTAWGWVKIGNLTSSINRTEVATIALRDALVLNTDFSIGDYISVSDNGYGEKVKYKYMYDEASTSLKWIEIGLLSNIQTG